MLSWHDFAGRHITTNERDAMVTLHLIQAIVPLVFIAWLAFAPPNSWVGYWTQVIATGIGLWAISLTGIWIFPPYWVPIGFAVLLFGATITGVLRRRNQPVWPKRVWNWQSLFLFAALGLYAANEVRIAFAASAAPTGRVIDLASPLGPGKYLVANGGAAPSINAHAAFLDQSVTRR